MVRKKVSIGVILVFLLIIFSILYYFRVDLNLFAVSSTKDSCEIDRSCCKNVGLNFLCWRNDIPDFSSFDAEDIKVEAISDVQVEQSVFFMHPRNGYFYSNQGDINFGWGMKGGMTHINSPMYGNVEGWHPLGEGNVDIAMWYPHKYQAYNYQNNFEYELEVVYLKNAVLMKTRAKCKNTAGCNAIGRQLTYNMNNLASLTQTASTPVYGTYGGLPGFMMNIKGTGWENPTYDKNWYFLVNQVPDGNSVVLPNNGKIFYNLAYGETKDLIFVVMIQDDLSLASDMLTNYDKYELQAKNDFEDYASGFTKINGDDTTQKLYYRSIYTLYTYMFPPSGSMTNSFITPNIGRNHNPFFNMYASGSGTSNYMGMWVWDSAIASLGFVSSCNPGNTCWNDLRAIQNTWDTSTYEYPTIQNWCGEIHPNGNGILKTNCPINVPGLWSMITYNKFLKDLNMIEMCSIYPNLKSNYYYLKQNRDSDNDYLFVANGGELGRDGTSNALDGEQPILTGWMILDSLYMSKISTLCAPADKSYYDNQYNNLIQAYESSFWSSNYQTYCYISTPNTCLVSSGVEHEDALTLGFAGIFNTYGGAKDSIIINKILSNLKDVYYPTSIPTSHPCYTAQGIDKPECNDGETWDGPVWQQDEFILNEMYLQMIKRGVANSQIQYNNYNQQTINLYNTLMLPAESYNSHTGYSASWGATPHSVGAGYIIYQISGKQLINPEESVIPEPENINVVCIGDSNTAWVSNTNPTTTGYCNRLAIDNNFIDTSYIRAWNGISTYNFIYNCYNSEPGCIDLITSQNLPVQWAIVMIGTNDVQTTTEHPTTTEEYYSYLTQSIVKLKNKGYKVILSTIPPQSDSNNQLRVIERNNVIRRVSDEQDVNYVDIFSQVFNGVWTHDLMKWDGVHIHLESEEGIICDYIKDNGIQDCGHYTMAQLYAESMKTGAPYNCFMKTDCYNVVCSPATEICDNIDNDCDSVIDEGCNVCVPSIEICDNKDNDCDNLVDENNVCNVCVPATEVCDGKDNDCDNLVDEGVLNTCTNYNTCFVYTQCGSCPSVPIELCDNKDNDCDGTIDETCNCLTGETKQCGATDIGVCQYGIQTCNIGVWSACVGNINPVTEICDDNLDNNCNGIIDEACSIPEPTPEPNNDLLYVGGGISAGAIILLLLKFKFGLI